MHCAFQVFLSAGSHGLSILWLKAWQRFCECLVQRPFTAIVRVSHGTTSEAKDCRVHVQFECKGSWADCKYMIGFVGCSCGPSGLVGQWRWSVVELGGAKLQNFNKHFLFLQIFPGTLGWKHFHKHMVRLVRLWKSNRDHEISVRCSLLRCRNMSAYTSMTWMSATRFLRMALYVMVTFFRRHNVTSLDLQLGSRRSHS